jgi:drug/metabolite transporter (DMT)-like permease
LDITSLSYILLLSVIFGTTLIASRFSVGQFEPVGYIWLRLAIASLAYILTYFLRRQGHKFPRDPDLIRHSAAIGVFGTALPMTLIVLSLQYQSSGLTSIMITLGPAITVIFAHFLLEEEKLNLRRSSGAFLALLGAIVISARGETGLPGLTDASPLGSLFVLAGVTCASAATIYTRKYMRGFDSIDVTSIRMLVATIVITPVALYLDSFVFSRVESSGVLVLLYAAMVGTFAGMLLAFQNIKRFGATAAVMTLYFIPIVSTIGGVLLLDETVTPGMLAGMALIVFGVVLINYRKRRVVLPETP